ncbi:DNA replication protein DnaC [Peptoclostridium litorale DSM 5388]|uniref:IstB-like ATP binding family protein n=1 Tax=Peptoclostridium litorale DSM 5388 TaxID=1121324 RepID=A0A069RH33_PEPLI|nr:ATP-binding protein [Peptoclostridium litorale]KDR96349.1 IstB-like ATP binding family protein [Peptoclostridium litorale DSM 5388]SIO26789.1 DNA replication protein DnaC [Peptoclostridium litorale DSM 5388]
MREQKIRTILLNYEKKRDKAHIDLEHRKKEIYSKFPQIEKIDSSIFSIGLKMSRLALENPNMTSEIVLQSKQKIEALKQEKDSILKANGYSPDYLKIKFECPLCNDKGFLKNGQKCKCLRQEIISEAYNMSNIRKVIQKENLSTFNLDIFSDTRGSDEPCSQKENMANILTICDDFIRDFNKNTGENLLFYGTTGSGKTFMCNCIAKDLLDKGYFVIYQTAFALFEIVENHKFQKGNRDIGADSYRSLFESDLLIIDDLGTEIQNSFTNSELFHIINSRLVAGKKTVISTNLSLGELSQRYTDRIFSRISSSFTLLKFFGKDLRWENR